MATTGQTQEPIHEPHSYSEYYRQGWALHSSGKQEAAEESVRKAISLEPNSIDAHYLLGLTLKSQDRRKEAVQCFEQVLVLLENDMVGDSSRKAMLRRLAMGHINQVKIGDWNLEKEVWQRK